MTSALAHPSVGPATASASSSGSNGSSGGGAGGDLGPAVAALRAEGRSPKEIARALGVRPALVAPLLRRIAAEQGPRGRTGDIVTCLVNKGWADVLDVDPEAGWPMRAGANGSAGLASVVVAREAGGTKVSACCYLVDTHCLGVKSVIGPRSMSRHQLASFVRQVYSTYGAAPLEAPIGLAQQLVLGAVAFARRLGFEPPGDLAGCLDHLGDWDGRTSITFGRHGRPTYVAGPYDDEAHVLETLDRSLGPGNYDVILGLSALGRAGGG